jgi:hypothetical protein
MGRKRRPSAHQRQIRFFTVSCIVLVTALGAALLWLLNRSPGALP